ncbi:hypothetical protein D4764_05G0014380 [Takifugu flavidus]|uniref:PiggyBac transposable element-derived protein domain-containing protein n=1 Tax=Takifugu flavidus TaxID=433684 RepID=A0A5C6N3G6_9TELE|nr:hypothetical protein D4764_05G0014380 [Takifugu flavidus]
MSPLVAKGAQGDNRYVPWSFMDMITLAGKLTPLAEGADKGIEKITGGINLAGGDIKALLIKTAGQTAAAEIFRAAGYRGMTESRAHDEVPFDRMRTRVRTAERARERERERDPSRMDPTKAEKQALEDQNRMLANKLTQLQTGELAKQKKDREKPKSQAPVRAADPEPEKGPTVERVMQAPIVTPVMSPHPTPQVIPAVPTPQERLQREYKGAADDRTPSSLSATTMSARYKAEEALELIFTDVQQDSSDSEEEVEDLSEEDGRNTIQSMMNCLQRKKTLKLKETFLSKNGKITWSSTEYDQHGRHAEENVIKMTPGPTRLLRFDDRESRPARRVTDKLAAIRDVWDKWVERLPYLYNPGPDVTVDEQLVPFRGRCPFRQYMPSKPAKYGIKSWVACDAKSSYAWKMQVYTGKPTSGCPEKNQGMRVVLDVTEGLRVHNFERTSLSSHLHCLHQKRAVLSSKFAFTPTTTLVSYLPKKNKNVVLSTLHRDSDISDRGDRKPVIILDYNRNKGGVDNLDKVIGTYSCRRMTARWPLVIFHNIIDVSSYNAFVIWSETNPNWMSPHGHAPHMGKGDLLGWRPAGHNVQHPRARSIPILPLCLLGLMSLLLLLLRVTQQARYSLRTAHQLLTLTICTTARGKEVEEVVHRESLKLSDAGELVRCSRIDWYPELADGNTTATIKL